MKKSLVFIIIALIIISFACKKKSEPESPRPLLMTVNVIDRYFHPILGGVIFISDMQGRVLADTFCQSDGTYRFFGKTGTSSPDFLEVTTVKVEPFWHSFNISIETYTHISPSEWTVKGSRADTIGEIYPVYQNIPAHDDVILISSSGYSNLTFTPGLSPIPLFKSPDDIYFLIPTPEGMRFKLFSGILANTKDTFDLENLLIPEKSMISFPFPVQYFECRIQGFPDADYNSPIPFMADEILGNGTIVNSFDIYYPPSTFQGFHTEIQALEDYSSPQTWYYHVDGQIPATFRKISATVNSYSPTNTSIQLKASGDLDAVSATWGIFSPYQGIVEWTIYSPDTTTVMQLPQIAPALNNMLPWLSRDSFAFYNLGVTDLVNCQDYNQMINVLFDPLHPSNINRQETSSLSIVPLKK